MLLKNRIGMVIRKWVPMELERPQTEADRISELEKQIEQHVLYETYLIERLKKAEK